VEREAEGDLFLSSDKTFAGVEADCAHLAKGVVIAFRACLAAEPSWQDLSGSYRFRLRLPKRPPGARLQLRVVDAGAAPELLAPGRACAGTVSTSRSTCTPCPESGS
jgi:hypothetical protein